MIIEHNPNKKQVSLWSSNKIFYYGSIGNIHRIETSILDGKEHRLYNKDNKLTAILHGKIKTKREKRP